MQGSQDKLKKALEEKLFDFEAPVSRSSREAVLNQLRDARKLGTIRKVSYTTGIIVMIASLTYVVQNNSAIDPSALATSVNKPTVASDQAKAPNAVHSTDEEVKATAAAQTVLASEVDRFASAVTPDATTVFSESLEPATM